MRVAAVVACVACAACASGSTIVTVPASGTPALVAYRSGTGPWQTPARTVDGYELVVTGEYELWRVCTSPTGHVDVQQLRATDDDAAPHLQPTATRDTACDAPPPAEARADISGGMEQSGTISIGDSTQTSTSQTGWMFRVPALRGPSEVVATDYDRFSAFVATHMARFSLDVVGNQNIGVIDLQLAPVLEVRSLEVTGDAEDATVFGDVTLVTAAGTRAVLAGLQGESHSLGIPVFPLVAGDVVTSSFTTSRADVQQTASVREPSGLASVQLLALAPAELDAATGVVTWRAIDDRRQIVEAAVSSASCATCVLHHRIAASSGWLARHGDHALPLFGEVPPGFDPAWTLDLSRATSAAFVLRASLAGVDLETTTALPAWSGRSP